jgi:hypothetical protein
MSDQSDPRQRGERIHELYLGKTLEHIWERELSVDKDVLIACPYLTPKLASNVLKSCNAARLLLLTRFELIDFVTGASSLEVLRELVRQPDAKVFHVRGLHAKIVTTNDIATLGSQNLTEGSRSNIEASVFVRSPKQIQQIQSFLKKLGGRQATRQIKIDDIERMEQQVSMFRKEWNSLRKRIEAVDPVLKKEKEQRRQKRAAKTQRRQRRKLVEETQQNLTHLLNASRPRTVNLRPNNKTAALIKIPNEPSLLQWTLASGSSLGLLKGMRYPLYEEGSGRVAWLRLNEAVASKFTTGFTRDFDDYTLDVSSERESGVMPADRPANVIVKLIRDKQVVKRVAGWLNEDGLSISESEPARGFSDEDLLADLSIPHDRVEDWVEEMILKDFTFRGGYKWDGKRVDELFQVSRGTATLRVVSVKESPLIVLNLSQAF